MKGPYVERVEAAARFVVERLGRPPETAVVLGSGLGGVAQHARTLDSLMFEDIPGATPTGVTSHRGALTSSELSGVPVWLVEGRVHLYEGADIHEVVFLTRVLARCGVSNLILTNACGGLNPAFRIADIMMVTDHINLMGISPLEGPNHDGWGVRFPDMSAPYAPSLQASLRSSASAEGIALHEGVYAAVKGPNLETRAEYRMIRGMGADVVGMSTVPEVIAAVHMGMKVAALSVITDLCDPVTLRPISIEEILEATRSASGPMAALLGAFLRGESR